MAAYATVAQFLRRYDVRRVADLNSDTGSPVTPGDPISLSTPDPVGQAILDASAMVDTALQSGARYLKADLALLLADADVTKGMPVTRVVCDIAYARLLMRRGYPAKEIERLCPGYKDALAWLKDLSDGKSVLDIPANIAAGLPQAGLTNIFDPNLMSNYNHAFGQWGYPLTWQ